MNKGAVLFIWDRIGDYHLARIKACEDMLDVPVYTANLGSGDALYKWENIKRENHSELSGKTVEAKDLINRFLSFRKLVKEKNITAIALGYGRLEYLLFLLYARLTGIKTIVFCESWYTRGGKIDYLKSLLLKVIGDYYFVSGNRAKEHFIQQYNIHPGKISMGYSVVDNEHFDTDQRFSERRNILLCVARYSDEKNQQMLIQAFQVSTLSKNYILQLVGAGPDQKKLQALCDASVQLHSWSTYNELPEIYKRAKIFILPSRFEPWGLVVNEAMAAGLPVLVSKECGCLPDLLEEQTNGASFAWNEEQQLTALLNLWNTYSDEQLEVMGKRSQKIIEKFSPQKWAETIQKLLNQERK